MACDTPIFIRPDGHLQGYDVPCGKCPPCKRRRVNSWVFRLQEEDKVSSSSHFVTFTYDTCTVPISPKGYMTLCKKDFQDFMKRLRKLTSNKIRYYACGEYGKDYFRPHYHAIVFNVPDPEMFHTAWGKGKVVVGTVAGASIAYTTKYIDKPSRIPLHRNDDRLKEFSLMSKGLGSSYLTPAKLRYHQADLERNYLIKEDGVMLALPKYYRTKIYDEDQRRAQVRVIKQTVYKQRYADEVEFLRRFPDGDYDRYVDSARYGRHKSFYRNTNFRNEL